MSRPLALAFVATLLAGCKSYPKVDPVYGRQTIPSQRTGSLGAVVPREGTPPPPQYYDQGAPAQGNLPDAPGAGNNLAPPGGFGFQGSSSRTEAPDSGASSGWSRPGTSGEAGVGSASGIPARTGPDDPSRRSAPGNSTYGQSRYDNPPGGLGSPPSGSIPPLPTNGSGAIPPRANDFPAAPGSGADNWSPGTGTPYRSTGYDRVATPEPRGASSDGQRGVTRDLSSARPRPVGRGEIVDIMDLPARGSLHPDDASFNREVRPSGYAAFAAPQETAVRPSADASSSVAEGDTYGYDPSYRWLKGHLEYSPANQRWKLRYIPITGRTDPYGGSVMLEDSPALQEMRPGDAAMIEGQIAGDGEPDSFAPLYRVTRISRLR